MAALPGSCVLGSKEINAEFNRIDDLVDAGSLALAQLLLTTKFCVLKLEGTQLLIPFLSSCLDFDDK